MDDEDTERVKELQEKYDTDDVMLAGAYSQSKNLLCL